MKDQIALLIEILFDPKAREDEKDDAAIYLGKFTDERAMKALKIVASNPKESFIVSSSAGESIAEIWLKKNHFDANAYKTFTPTAKEEVRLHLKTYKPEWLKYLES